MPGAAWTVATIALYAVAGLLYLAFLAGLSERVARAARIVLALGLGTHILETSAHALAGLHPVSSAHESTAFLSWLVVTVYLLASLRWRMHALGGFVAPAALAMLLVARLLPGRVAGTESGPSILGRVHILLATAGVSAFALAAALALLYLFQDHQLKRRRVGMLVRKGIALETLDTLIHRVVLVGFPVFTVAMVTGAIRMAQRSGELRPEYPIAMVTWIAFAALLGARTTAGWGGRRSAVMAVVGFSAAVIVFALYLARRAAGA